MNHKRMSAENYNNGQARGNFNSSFNSPNGNVFNPTHDWSNDSMTENSTFIGHNYNRKSNNKYQNRQYQRTNYNKPHRNFNASNRNANNYHRAHENTENQTPETGITEITDAEKSKCFNETLSDDSIMCHEKDLSNGSNEYTSHLKTENTSNDNSSGFGESHSSGVSIADLNNNYQEHVLSACKDEPTGNMYIDVNSTPQMHRQPLGELNPNNLSYDYEYSKNPMNIQSQGSPYYIWPAANNPPEYVSPQQSQPMAAFYQPYPTMPCVYGPIETNYASAPPTQPYSPIQNSATSAFAANLGSSPNVYISQQQYLATPPNPTSTLNNSPTMIPSQMSYPMYSSSYPSPIPAVVPIGAASMSSPMPSYLMTPPMSQCSASPKHRNSAPHHGKRNNNNYHGKKYNKTAYNNNYENQAPVYHHQDYYYNSQPPSDQTYLINASPNCTFNDNSTNNSLDEINSNCMMMDNASGLNTSASNANMIPMNPHDLSQAAPQFIYPNTMDGTFEYNENYNYSFGDDEYGDESKLEPVDDDSQLACRICRGRRMCFCYFLKVRYYKFPSFLDLVDHQYKKWRSSVVKSKKL